MNPPPRDTRTTLLIPALLLLFSFLIFARILGHGFLWWDDPDEIFANPAFLPPTWSGVLAYWTARPDETHYYKPVTQTVWGALAAFAYDPQKGTLTATPFHLASVAVHGLAGAVVFLLLRRMTPASIAAAVLGALLFLVHPIQVETVAWASGMKDLLCGLFTLLAVLEWLNAADPQSRRPRLHYAIATLCFLLALLSKPAGVVAPVLAGIAEWSVHRTPPRAIFLKLLPWLVISAGATIATKILMPAAVVERPALWQRPFIAGDALAFYLYKLLLPWNLAPDYGRRPGMVLGTTWSYVAWIIPATAALASWIAWRRRLSAPAVGLAILIVSVLPVLGLVPTEFQYYSTVADHYLYTGMWGVAILLAVVVQRARTRWPIAAAAGLMVLLAVISVRQAGYWKDDLKLFHHTVKVNPQSFAGYSQLGFAYWQAGQPEQSAEAYRHALRINPDHPNAHDIWIHYARKGELDAAIGQLTAYITAVEKTPLLRRHTLPMLHNYRGELLLVQGRSAEAAADFRRALALDPALAIARQNLARISADSPPATP